MRSKRLITRISTRFTWLSQEFAELLRHLCRPVHKHGINTKSSGNARAVEDSRLVSSRVATIASARHER